jgi:hemolysin activation/secretion protein
MRHTSIVRLAIWVAASGTTFAMGASEPVPTAPVFLNSLPKPQPRFTAPPRSEVIVGTRLQNPAAPAVLVTKFEFVGASAIPVAELEARVAAFVGRPLASADVDAAAELVAMLYRSRGYPLAAAALASPIAGGVARLQVYEGRLGEVRVEGHSLYTEEAMLYPTTDLPRGKALTTSEVEGALLMLDDQPGLDVRGQALPGRIPGESDLIIKATESPYEFGVKVDNDGVESVGRQRYGARLRINSLSGWGDQLDMEVFNADMGGSYYGRLDYTAPIDTEMVAGVSYALGKYEVVSDGIAGLGVDGDTSELRSWLSIATFRSRAFTREWRVSFQRLEGQSYSGYGAVELEDGAMYDYGVGLFDSSWNADGTGWTRSFEFDSNFEHNDGTDPEANLGQIRVAGSLLRQNGSWQTLLKGRAFYSLDIAVPLKQFRLGGPQSVRAYDYSQEVGDGGFDATIELLAPLGTAKGTRNQFAMFIDVGYAALKDSVVSTGDENVIAGAGLGWRLSAPRFGLALDYAYPIGQHATPDGDDNGYFWGRLTLGF